MKSTVFHNNLASAIFHFISANRFSLLVLLIFYKITIETTNGIWYGDFWEHSAVVQALIENTAAPSHPFFSLQAPHAFISPYHWITAIFAKYFNFSAIESLGLFGVLNFCLFTLGLKVFIEGFESKVLQLTCFYSFLFILFLWGNNPWGFSGFFYFELLADVLPYPSTFATALSLIGLGLGFKLDNTLSIIKQLSLILISTLVLLSHPLTFIFLTTGLICQAVTSKQIFLSIAHRLIIFAIATGIAFLWPFYSIFALLTGAGDVYHSSNRSMYMDVLIKIWPIIVLLPLLWPVFKRQETRPVFLHLLVLVAVYFFGWFTGKYSYGRDITFIVILIQILLASQFAHFETLLSQFYPRTTLTYGMFLGLILLCLASTWLYPTMTRSLTVLNSFISGRSVSNQHMYKNLTFLSKHLIKGSVVLSDLDTSWLVPSFGGKVVGALHVQAFVSDDEQRRVDLLDFFSDDASSTKRQSIIQKYKPDYLLIDKFVFKDWKEILNSLDSFSKTSKVYENDQYILFRFD